MGRTTKVIGGAAMALAVGASLAEPAAARPGPPRPGLAGGSDALVTSGACDGASTWTLSVRSRRLKVVAEARIQTDRRRTRWVVRVLHNGTTVAARARKPTGRGVVKVKARVGNAPGTDTFTLVARNRKPAETCQGTLTF